MEAVGCGLVDTDLEDNETALNFNFIVGVGRQGREEMDLIVL